MLAGRVKPYLLVALGLVLAAALFSTGGTAIKAAQFTARQLASFRWAIAGWNLVSCPDPARW